MQLFPGIAPLTVATSGAGPGVIVTSGPTDTHGWWPGPFEAQGNDPRSAANLMAMGEALTDRTNWIGWRVADFIFGGDYIALFRGLVQFGNVWTLDRSWNNGTEAVVQIFGPTGGGNSLDVFAGGGNGNAVRGSGFGTGSGLVGIGGATGAGGNFTGGATGGNGVACTGTGNSNGLVCQGAGTGHGIIATVAGSGYSVNCQGSQLITGNLVHSGASAVNVLRETALASVVVTAGGSGGHLVANADNTFDPSQTDVIYMGTAPTITSDRTWTLTHPPGGTPCTVLLKAVASSFGGSNQIGIFDSSGGSPIVVFGSAWADARIYFSPTAGSWLASI